MKVQTFALDEKYPDVTLTSYVLDDSRELLNGQTRPAVLIMPGGGYFSCSDREAEPIALLFNNHGYHAFVLRYATYLEGKNNLSISWAFGKIREVSSDCWTLFGHLFFFVIFLIILCLCIPQFIIHAVLIGKKFIVRSILHDLSMLKHSNLITEAST